MPCVVWRGHPRFSRISSENAAQATPSRKEVGPETHPYVITEFCLFRGLRFCRGIIEHSRRDRPEIFVLTPDQHVIPTDLDFDDVHVSSDTRTCFMFSARVPRTLDGKQRLHHALRLLFRSDQITIWTPGSQRLNQDQFLATEKVFWDFVDANESMWVLEIGSRARSGISLKHLFRPPRHYTGFDISPGPNVDVVGDAHNLSHHLPHHSFDAAFSVFRVFVECPVQSRHRVRDQFTGHGFACGNDPGRA